MDEALDLYQELGLTDAIGRLSWAMVYQLTWTARVMEAVQAAQRSLAALGDVATADRARLVSSIGWALSLGGDYATATTMFEQGRALVEQLGDDRALADVLHMQTIHHMGFGEFAEGVQVGLRAAEVFEREGALWDLCSVQSFVVYQDGAICSREQADALGDKTMAIAERLGHLGAIFMLLSDRVREHAAHGQLDAVERMGRLIIDVCERGGLPWLYVGHLYAGLAGHWRGDAERAEAELRRAVELEPPGAYSGQSAADLALHLAQAGRPDDVWAVYETFRPHVPDRRGPQQHRGLELHARDHGGAVPRRFPGRGRHARAPGRHGADARAGVGRVRRPTGQQPRRDRGGRHRTVGRRRAVLHRGAGPRAAHAERAGDGRRRRLHGRVLLDRGRPEDAARAAEMLGKACESYRSFGMPGYVAEVEGMLSATSRLGAS